MRIPEMMFLMISCKPTPIPKDKAPAAIARCSSSMPEILNAKKNKMETPMA
jgi:hypothetical protein